MDRQKKVFVATPMYGGMCCATYTRGLLDSSSVLVNNGYRMLFMAIGNESLITRARNEIVYQFLQQDADYLMFIDADIGFKGEDILKLIRSDKDLICGLYPKKFIDWKRINHVASLGIKNVEDYAASYVVDPVHDNLNEELTSSIVEIEHAGTGFMLIKREVFEKLAPFVKQYRVSTVVDQHGQIPPLVKEFFALDIVGDENPYLLSEDYFFCQLWKKHGGKVYADLSIELTHMGSYEFKGNLWVGGANCIGPSNNKEGRTCGT